MEISLCMIVRDEEAVLDRCLGCAARFADEIVVVDTGSTDATMEIARRYTQKVLRFQWCDDFSAARNYAFDQATKDYIMWLDADDLMDEENIQKLRTLKETLDPAVDVAMLRYNVGFDGSGHCNFSYFRERLVRRANNYRWQEPVHEHLATWGDVRRFEIAVIHGHKERAHSTRNLGIYRAQIAAGKELSPRALYYFARELRTHNLLDEAIEYYQRFLAIEGVWVEDYITACGDLAACHRARGETRQAMERYVQSFSRDLPRAELCCGIADLLREQGDIPRAIFWYEQALRLPQPTGDGFVSLDCWGYIPHMQLCMLYDQSGDSAQALKHHLAARALKPDDPSVLHNQRYFFPHGEDNAG